MFADGSAELIDLLFSNHFQRRRWEYYVAVPRGLYTTHAWDKLHEKPIPLRRG